LTSAEAIAATSQLLAAFPHVKSTSPAGFIGAVAALLTEYPRQVALKCANPVKGIARECKFLSIAELVEWCEREKASLERLTKSTETIEKPRRAYPIGGKPGDPFPEKIAGRATRSGLMEEYGLTAIPGGWDAIDVCQAAAKHGAGLQAYVDDVIAGRAAWSRGKAMQTVGQVAAKMWKTPTENELREHYKAPEKAAE